VAPAAATPLQINDSGLIESQANGSGSAGAIRIGSAGSAPGSTTASDTTISGGAQVKTTGSTVAINGNSSVVIEGATVEATSSTNSSGAITSQGSIAIKGGSIKIGKATGRTLLRAGNAQALSNSSGINETDLTSNLTLLDSAINLTAGVGKSIEVFSGTAAAPGTTTLRAAPVDSANPTVPNEVNLTTNGKGGSTGSSIVVGGILSGTADPPVTTSKITTIGAGTNLTAKDGGKIDIIGNTTRVDGAIDGILKTRGEKIVINGASNLKNSQDSDNNYEYFADNEITVTNLNYIAPEKQELAARFYFKAGGSINFEDSVISITPVTDKAGGFIIISDNGNISIKKSALTANGSKGVINIDAKEKIIIEDSTIQSVTNNNPGGSATLKAGEILIREQSGKTNIATSTTGTGKGGELKLNTNNLSIDGGTLTVASSGTGQAGEIQINGSSDGPLVLYLDKETKLSAATKGAGGSGGSISINAVDRDMTISGGGLITVETEGKGDAGNISFAARNINLDQGLRISAKTSGIGRGGNINLNANTIILDNGAEVSTNSENNGSKETGPAGSISITATGPNSLHLRNGSKISSATSSTKDWTNPTDLANIIINTPHLSMEGGSSINASTSSVASGGGITLYSPWVELAGGSKITTASTGSGAGGNININGTRVQLSNKSEISAAGENNGQAGSINLNLRDQLQLDNGSQINASTARSTTNDGGANININLGGNLILNNGSSITASATGKANGGNIKLSLPKGFLLSSFPPSFGGNDILASAEEGNGGRIELRALGIFGVNKNTFGTRISEASAKSRSGRNGVLAFYIPYLTPDRGVVPIQQPLDPDNDLVRACSPRTAGPKAAFTQTGRGGLPILPGTRPSSSPLFDDLGRPALRQGRLNSSPLPSTSLRASSATSSIARATQLQDPGRPLALPLPPCPEPR
jgi:hypothetical protein